MDGLPDTVSSAIANSPPPFLCKTFDIVDNPSTNSVVSWSKSNNSFVVWNVPEFARDLLPKYFRHSNFSSFVRQLNTYGFRKVDLDRWEFANEGFLRGQKHLLKSISRRKPGPVQSHQQPPQVQSTPVGSCVEVGKFVLEEEVERLKRDKNVLMQQHVRMRQQQQATDHQLQTVWQHVQLIEQKQQQMILFLAKAMQSPGFFAQLVQQQNEGSRCISGVNKKRRLPMQDEEKLVGKHDAASPDGQIVKYQPLMNEAAEAMLRQILKINTSARLDPTLKNANGFLIDNVCSPSNILDSGSFSGEIAGVTLSEELPTSSQSFTSADSGISFNLPSVATSEIQSSPSVASGKAKVSQFPQMNASHPEEDTVLPDFYQVQGIMTGSTVEVPDMSFKGCEAEDMGYTDTIPGFVGEALPVVPDEFSSDPDVGILVDEILKLPGIDDVFWEQFLSVSPLTGDTDEINSCTLEGGVVKELELQAGQNSEWEKTKHMNHPSEQLGLLTSCSKRG